MSSHRAETPRITLAHRHSKRCTLFPSRMPELHYAHQQLFNLKPKRATVHSHVCVLTHTSIHIYKNGGCMHLPYMRLCNPHPRLCTDVLHQHIKSRATLWLGLAAMDDQNSSLGLWTAHDTSADTYIISCITRRMVVTGTAATEEPLAIYTSNMQPSLVWLCWQLVNI